MANGARVWITRARPGAERTSARLTSLGFTPVVAPLLEISPLHDALAQAPALATVQALAFTSPNGVEAFAALVPAPRLRDLPVFAVGDATAEAARAAGFADARSASGDIHDLARLIDETWRGGLVLNPGAREPAGDLAALVANAPVRGLPVYAAHETGSAAPAFDRVLIHSPRAGRALAGALTPFEAEGRLAVCISQAAAAPLAALPFTEVRIASSPDEASLLTALGKPSPPV